MPSNRRLIFHFLFDLWWNFSEFPGGRRRPIPPATAKRPRNKKKRNRLTNRLTFGRQTRIEKKIGCVKITDTHTHTQQCHRNRIEADTNTTDWQSHKRMQMIFNSLEAKNKTNERRAGNDEPPTIDRSRANGQRDKV